MKPSADKKHVKTKAPHQHIPGCHHSLLYQWQILASAIGLCIFIQPRKMKKKIVKIILVSRHSKVALYFRCFQIIAKGRTVNIQLISNYKLHLAKDVSLESWPDKPLRFLLRKMIIPWYDFRGNRNIHHLPSSVWTF